MDSMLQKLGLKEGEAIVHPWINKALERAQKKVEARNFDIRKNLLKYDDVTNDQRKVIFEQRIEMMDSEDVSETIEDMRNEVIEVLVAKHIPERAYAEQWSVKELREDVDRLLNLDLPIEDWATEEGIGETDIRERITAAAEASVKDRRERFGADVMNYVERSVVLQTLDALWREHIVNLDHLRSVIGFRGYAQRDPLQEYKAEAFELFQALLANLREAVTAQMMRVELVQNPEPPVPPSVFEEHHFDPTTGEDQVSGADGSDFIAAPADRHPEDQSTWGRVGRNEACPCGSGKKYKHCHGAFEQA
jgi:preprotein translocase subunit SecA